MTTDLPLRGCETMTSIEIPLESMDRPTNLGQQTPANKSSDMVDSMSYPPSLYAGGNRSSRSINTTIPEGASVGGDLESPSTSFIPALPPVDGGKQAWLFLAAATTIEALVWGLPFSIGILHEYWTSELFKGQGHEGQITLAATLQTGMLYISAGLFGP